MKTTLRKDLNIAMEHPGAPEFEERAICHFLAALERCLLYTSDAADE